MTPLAVELSTHCRYFVRLASGNAVPGRQRTETTTPTLTASELSVEFTGVVSAAQKIAVGTIK